MSAAARPRDPSDEAIRVALTELRTFEGLTKDPSTTRNNKNEMEVKANNVNEELRSVLASGAFASKRESRKTGRGSLTAFIVAVDAYLNFERDVSSPENPSPALARQYNTNRNKMWSDMRKALGELLDNLTALS